MADETTGPPTRSSQSFAACTSRVLQYKHSGFDKGLSSRRSYQSNYSEASILILLVVKKGKTYVRLTRRSENLKSHKGQVVFPGGKKDEADGNFTETALREANEEIGLPSENVEIITSLSPRWIRRNKVFPVIGVLKKEFEIEMNTFEVDAVFDVPLEFFLFEEHHYTGAFDTGDRIFNYHQFMYNALGSDILQGGVDVDNFHIFGFTAAFCLTIAIIVLNRLPPFELMDVAKEYELQAYIEWLSQEDKDQAVKSKM